MRRFIDWFGDNISNVGLTVAAAGLIVIVAINGINVVARYVFRSPFSWAEAAMLFIMIVGVFWGAIAVAWRQVDICIDAFVNLASGHFRIVLRTISSLISIGILSSLFVVSSRVTLQLYSFGVTNDALRLPMWIPHSAFASGLLLIILMTVARLFAPARSEAQEADHKRDQSSNQASERGI